MATREDQIRENFINEMLEWGIDKEKAAKYATQVAQKGFRTTDALWTISDDSLSIMG
jgi:hypothetical protein